MQMCTVKRSTTPDVSIPRLYFWMALHSFLAFRSTLVTSLWSLLHEYHQQYSIPLPENSCQ
jgi:hypothetical protein